MLTRPILKLFILPVLLSLSLQLKAAEPYTVMFSENGYMPYFSIDGQQVGGLYRQLLDALEQQYDLSFKYYTVPRKRIESIINDAEYTLILSNPSWFKQLNPAMLLTRPFYAYKDRIFLRKGLKSVSTLEELKGLTLCGRHGFVYSATMEAMLGDGRLRRVNSPSNSGVVKMLLLERCDFTILDEGVMDALLKDLEVSTADFVRTPLVDASWPQRFILTPDSTELYEILQKAIASGFIEDFFRRQGYE